MRRVVIFFVSVGLALLPAVPAYGSPVNVCNPFTCVRGGGEPFAGAAVAITGTNTYSATGGSSGWPSKATYTFEFRVWVDNELRVDYNRVCIGLEACTAPTTSGTCGNPLTVHTVYARADAFNAQYQVAGDDEGICN